ADEARQMERDVPQLIRKGLRVQTQLAGLTGQQYLAIDLLDPARYPSLPFDWTPEYTYLPSAPSAAGEIVANVQAFLARLNEVDIATFSRNVNTLVSDLDRKLNELPAAELAADARKVLADAGATLARIDRLLADERVDEMLNSLDSASARV